MTRMVFHVDVGNLPASSADELLKKLKRANEDSGFIRDGDSATYIANSKGFTSVEVLPEMDKKYILITAYPGGVQEKIDTFFGPDRILVLQLGNIDDKPVLMEVQA